MDEHADIHAHRHRVDTGPVKARVIARLDGQRGACVSSAAMHDRRRVRRMFKQQRAVTKTDKKQTQSKNPHKASITALPPASEVGSKVSSRWPLVNALSLLSLV